MKIKITLITLLMFSVSGFSQEETTLEKYIKQNINLKREKDSLQKVIKSLEDNQKDLETKILESKKTENKLIIDNKELKADLSDIKKDSYSKSEYNSAIDKKNKEIDSIKNQFKLKEKQFEIEKKNLQEKNNSTQSILKEMNETFFEKKIKDNYTIEYFNQHHFLPEDEVNIRKFEVMISSLDADPSKQELRATKILENAKRYNELYFKLFEIYSIFDQAYDSSVVSNALIKLNQINIPTEFGGLIKSKLQLKKLLENYCVVQSNLVQKLIKTEQIKDRQVLAEKLEAYSKNDEFKDYKYLREFILQYAKEKKELPKSNCITIK